MHTQDTLNERHRQGARYQLPAEGKPAGFRIPTLNTREVFIFALALERGIQAEKQRLQLSPVPLPGAKPDAGTVAGRC